MSIETINIRIPQIFEAVDPICSYCIINYIMRLSISFQLIWFVSMSCLSTHGQGTPQHFVRQRSSKQENVGFRGRDRTNSNDLGVEEGYRHLQQATTVRFVLFNSRTDEYITDLINGTVVNLSALGLSSSQNLNIEAVLAGNLATIGYVQIAFNTNYIRNDSNSPYTLCKSRETCGTIMTIGTHTISARPYSPTGQSLAYYATSFQLVSGFVPPPTSPIVNPTRSPTSRPTSPNTRSPTQKPSTRVLTGSPVQYSPTITPGGIPSCSVPKVCACIL
jgi:hypothetical protein